MEQEEQAEGERHNMTSRTGQEELDRQKGTGRPGQVDRTGRAGYTKRDSRTGQAEQDRQNKTVKTGQAEQAELDRQN